MTLMIDDRDLEKEPDLRLGGSPPDGGPPVTTIAVAGAVIILLIAGGGWWMSRRAQPPAATPSTPRAVNATDAAINTEPPVVLPPLEQMDAFLRPLLAALSSRPELAAWLATDQLLRQMAAAIAQASAGVSPARDFVMLKPQGPFTPAGRANQQRTIDPASYRRFDGLVATVTSMDAAAAAKVYRTIRPRLNEAYQGLGNTNRDVHNAVHNAIDIMLDTPVVQPPVRVVVGKGAAWNYADPSLESLLPTQKQLVRMGPAHTEAMQTWLRAFKNAIQ